MMLSKKQSTSNKLYEREFVSDDIDENTQINPCESLKNSTLPIGFKGMILLEIWKKNSLQISRQIQDRNQSPYQQAIDRKRKKQQYLVKWHFLCNKQKIISKTLNNILSQQKTTKNSLFYRLKKLVTEENEREKIQQLKRNQVVQKQNQNKQSIEIQVNQVIQQAEIKVTPVLEEIKNVTKTQNESSPQQKKEKHQKVKIKMKVKDVLIQKIEQEMGRQFKKLDKIIHKVNQIQKSTIP